MDAPSNLPSAPRRPSQEAIQALREAASALDVEEVLDLCFAFSKDPVRLVVYLDVLRGKGGQKAQAAACLVCFDLARRGDVRFEAEFLALVPVMRGFIASGDETERPIERLLGESAYLRGLWSDLEERLVGMDPRWEHSAAEEVVDLDADVLEVELLDADDLLEIDLGDLELTSTDDELLARRWHDALERFYDVDQGIRTLTQVGGNAMSVSGGFFADAKPDLARVEELRAQALSFRDSVDDAAELLPLIELFLASHTRAKNLFGKRNKARDATLRAGLEHFLVIDRPPPLGAWLAPPTSQAQSWEKVAEILLDFISFLASIDARQSGTLTPAVLAAAYVASERPQPPPQRLAQGGAARRRR